MIPAAKANSAISMPKTTKRDAIVAIWVALNRPSVGAKELRAVQKALREELRVAPVASPAFIARVLADEGAELGHPDVIEFDAQWRQAQLDDSRRRFKSLERFSPDQPLTIEQAVTLLDELERLRKRFGQASEHEALEELRSFAAEARQQAEKSAKDRRRDQRTRTTQREISEWLRVWLQTPALFADWVELRRRSRDFHHKFMNEETSR